MKFLNDKQNLLLKYTIPFIFFSHNKPEQHQPKREIMKSFTTLIITLTLITGADAQDLKTNTIGTDIGALAAGGTVLEYQKLINDGKNEIGVGGGPFNWGDGANWTGGWAWYRIYKNGNGEGLFYTVGCAAGPSSWDYTSDEGIEETVEGTLIWPQATIGKRWNMNSGLTVSPFIGVGYMVGEIKANDGTYLELPDGSKAEGGLGPSVGIKVGYMF
jgi:hypothetical protein